MKREPLPENPDNAALGQAIREVEECVHHTGDRLDARLTKHSASFDKRLARVNSRLTKIEKANAGMRHVLGVGEDGQVIRQTPMLMSRLGFFSTISGVVFGLFLIVQLGNAVWPSVDLMAHEVWAFVLQQPVGAITPPPTPRR